MRSTLNSIAVAAIATVIALAQQPAAQRDIGYHRTPQRLALIIGNGAYPKWPLRNPANDARSMAQALRDPGFQSEVVLNGSLRDMGRAVDGFVSRIGKGDVALFYYAGHGIQLAGENYLVPVDFDAADEADAKYASYSASRVQERMEEAGARMSLVVLDACRNNPFRPTRSAGGGLAVMNTGRGTFIAFATGPGRTADDNPSGSNGLFTSHLVSALREPGLTIDEVFSRVRERVYEDSGQRQLPWTVSSLIGTFRFNEGAKLTSAPVSRPAAENPLARLQRHAQPMPAATPVVTASAATAAYERGDYTEAIRVSEEVLRSNPTDKDALFTLAAGFFRTQRYDMFVPNAISALKTGVEFQSCSGITVHSPGFTFGSEIHLNRDAFDPLGSSECTQKPVQWPIAGLVSIAPATGSNGEVFLNLKIRDDQNKVRNFNFADRDSTVDRSSGLPIVRTPAHSQAAMQAIAVVVNSLRTR